MSNGHNGDCEGGYSCDCGAGEGGPPCSFNGCTGCSKCERSNACFPYFARVLTPFGEKPIGELQYGQLVFSYAKGVLIPRRITRKRERGIASVAKIYFESGNTLHCTTHHSFLTQKGWQRLDNLRSGDCIVQASGTQSRIHSIVLSNSREPVFNIYTAREHNFIVDGCVAHNFTHFRTTRKFLHNVFLDFDFNTAAFAT